jgi:predicted nucleic acid-binding protein
VGVAYYLDASALVKRYAAELGTTWIRGITSPDGGHSLLVALISGAEVVAAVAKRERMGSLRSTSAHQSISDFQNHFKAQYIVIALTREIIDFAMVLAPRRSLRGYDAVQLATALKLNDQVTTAGDAPITFVSADSSLNIAAAQEGLVVEALIFIMIRVTSTPKHLRTRAPRSSSLWKRSGRAGRGANLQHLSSF